MSERPGSKSKPLNRIVEVLNSPPNQVISNQQKREVGGFNIHASEGTILRADEVRGSIGGIRKGKGQVVPRSPSKSLSPTRELTRIDSKSKESPSAASPLRKPAAAPVHVARIEKVEKPLHQKSLGKNLRDSALEQANFTSEG